MRSIAAAAALAALAMFAGCDEEDPQQTRFEEALGTLPVNEPVGTGYGWVDIARLRERGQRSLEGDLGWASEALGPGAGDLAKPSAELAALGLDPLGADAALSVTSNYPFSVRFDGVETEWAEQTFEAAGAREGEEAGWSTFDLGRESSIPLDTMAEPLGSLAARSATRSGRLVLARTDRARSEMIGEGDRAIDADLVAAAAECLRDPVAARLMLNNHTHVPGLGPDLLAMGVLVGPSRKHAQEVFCAIDDDEARVETARTALEKTVSPGGRDEVTGEPFEDSLAAPAIDRYEGHGHHGVRLTATDAPGTSPGELFGAFDRGSMVTWIGLPAPPLPDDLRGPG